MLRKRKSRGLCHKSTLIHYIHAMIYYLAKLQASLIICARLMVEITCKIQEDFKNKVENCIHITQKISKAQRIQATCSVKLTEWGNISTLRWLDTPVHYLIDR